MSDVDGFDLYMLLLWLGSVLSLFLLVLHKKKEENTIEKKR